MLSVSFILSNTQEMNKIYSQNFETLKYNISNEPNDILLDNANVPDLNFFSKNIRNKDRVYFSKRNWQFYTKTSHMFLFDIEGDFDFNLLDHDISK